MSQTAPARQTIWQSASGFADRHHLFVVLLYLVALELLVFGPIIGRVGFYLDDWHALSMLNSAPKDLPSMFMWYFLNEPKGVTRPLEMLHLSTMYYFFGQKALWYHVFNALVEIAGAWFLYCCSARLTQSRVLSIYAAALFLLFPMHDSTHYWMVSSCVPMSLTLYLGSLLLTMRAAATGSKLSFAAAVLVYSASNFNYEVCLPLLTLNVLAAWYIARREGRARPVAYGAVTLGAFGTSALVFVIYAKYIAPLIAKAWIHAVSLDPKLMLDTISLGLSMTLGAEPIALSANLISVDPSQFDMLARLNIVVAFVLTALMTYLFPVGQLKSKNLLWLVASGIFAAALSFTIFGLNREYQPNLISIINRVNAPATIGVSLVYAAVLLGLFAGVCRLANQRTARAVLACTAAGVICFFALADVAFSKPWILSWTMQRHVLQVAKSNYGTIKNSSSVMLLNCPRYLRWSPVFDGVWDLQSAMRLNLKDSTLRADVPCERMEVTHNEVVDVSSGFMCGKFPFKGMVVLVAPKMMVLPVNTPAQFIEAVRTEGMGFDLDRKLPEKWQQQLIAQKRQQSI